jgi:methyltransferase-like protein/2-polyprenyl-3-methyl-5-hydroxy-6-metoxy-1,4-benzoquinol methylase
MTNLPAPTSYDKVPYPTIARPQTHPGHLAALATLLGLKPVPVQHCRVLDLGCADGSNIIPMAYQLPNSRFVGLDLSSRQIAAGQAKADALNLKNLTLKCMNILEVGPELGQFDYIVAHGVYSWVPPEVQTKVLEICQKNLSPQGVVYISYNVYPGWFMHGQVRDLMLYFTRHLTEPYTRVKQGRALLNFLTNTVPKLSSSLPEALEINHLILKSMQDILQNQPDEYLLHDHFEVNNEPLYLYQFIERAGQHGLQYLADAESSALITNYLPPHLVQSLQEMAGSRADLEQFMDFLYVRAFRQSLLCHQEVNLPHTIAPENLVDLHIASSARPAAEHPDIDSPVSEAFQSAIGTTLTTQQPLNKAALLYLSEIWPQAVSFKQLLAAVHARLNPHAPPVYSAAGYADDVHTLGTVLLKGYALNMVEFRAGPYPFVLESGDYPEASALARFEARQGKQVTNQRHEPVIMANDPGYYLLPYLDGQHSRAALLNKLMSLVSDGTLLTPLSDANNQNSGQLRPLLAESLAHSLRNLGRQALLVG